MMENTNAKGMFGTMIAAQVMEFTREGRGPPTEEDMERFIEEAETISNLYAKSCNQLVLARVQNK